MQSEQFGKEIPQDELEKRQNDAIRMAKKMGEKKAKEDGMERVPEIDDVCGQPPGGPIIEEDDKSEKKQGA